jgi:hypothetical protein
LQDYKSITEKSLHETVRLLSAEKGELESQITALQDSKFIAEESLRETVRSLKEEKSALELQIIALQDSNTVTLPSRKPQVLLIATSNIKGNREEKLTKEAEIHKVIKYTLEETLLYIQSCNIPTPDIVILHSLTNDLKHKKPDVCVGELEKITAEITAKWPRLKLSSQQQLRGRIIGLISPIRK